MLRTAAVALARVDPDRRISGDLLTAPRHLFLDANWDEYIWNYNVGTQPHLDMVLILSWLLQRPIVILQCDNQDNPCIVMNGVPSKGDVCWAPQANPDWIVLVHHRQHYNALVLSGAGPRPMPPLYELMAAAMSPLSERPPTTVIGRYHLPQQPVESAILTVRCISVHNPTPNDLLFLTIGIHVLQNT